MREARVGLQLRHPNVARVFEVHAEPAPFLVMELLRGVTLHSVFAHGHDELAARLAVPAILDVLRGLSALHGFRDEQGASGFVVHQAPSPRREEEAEHAPRSRSSPQSCPRTLTDSVKRRALGVHPSQTNR